MFGWWNNKKENFLKVDIHSHLIPGIDDGVKTLEESISVIKKLVSFGIEKIITTPHILSGYYPNTPDIIKSGLEKVRQEIKEQQIEVVIEAAAEYYLDESLVAKVDNGESLLSFGIDRYVLVETGFMTKPLNTSDTFFRIITNGYKPILAHPERYAYLSDDFGYLEELKKIGVLMQVNALSLIGHYSSEVRSRAEKLIKNEMVDFIGSDVHNLRHAYYFKKVIASRLFQDCKQLNLLNNALLE
ncbi:tyrosine-protein phosphatase [Reichenbachiella versicolor]|uniref:tyrosine-protein phosphatase n=1 Tax=Reichenbachiella versicolor TaxID=1821036 RepID=UPI000D6E0656|nr:CpsB/CapC family capsule biosynthesis tyrosine phosphatase [Reichenbachiella versicolor]